MDAWETLLDNSTISSGDAWEHLNAQGGTDTGLIDYIILADGLGVGMENETVAVEINRDGVEATVDGSHIGVGVDDQEILAEVTNGNI